MSEPPSHDITSSIYLGLRVRASSMLRRWRHVAGGPELSSLVDQTCLKLMTGEGTSYRDREHLLATWTRAMHSVLVDLARARASIKRGSDRRRVPLHDDVAADEGPDLNEILDVHAALERLHGLDPRDAQIVELRYYGGCTWEEVASVVGGTALEIRNEWRGVKAALRQLMTDGGS